MPTEAEWERVARGVDGREWPWGNEFDANRTNSFEGRGDWTTTPVGIYPQGASPEGALDMAGNLWEWTGSLYKPYLYGAADGREEPDAEGLRTLRGGSFAFSDDVVRCAYRLRGSLDDWLDLIGFRVVVASPGP